MADETAYPLKQVLEVKVRRVEDAEMVVKEKIAALEKEKQILVQRETERDAAKAHYKEKLDQMRHELDQGTTSPKVQQMKAYLKVVKDRVNIEEKKVVEQKKQVEVAEKNLEVARSELAQKRVEVDKLKSHRTDWLKEMDKEQQIIDGREQDELGSIIFSTRQRSGSNKKNSE